MPAATLFVFDAIDFSFQKRRVTCDESCAIIHSPPSAYLLRQNTNVIGVYMESSSAAVRQNKKFVIFKSLQ